MEQLLEIAAVVGISLVGYSSVAAADYKDRHPSANLTESLLHGLRDYTITRVNEIYTFYGRLFRDIRYNVRRNSKTHSV